MSERRSGLDNPISWSFGVGRLFGIRIRIHVLFVFGAIFVLLRAFHESQQGLPWHAPNMSLADPFAWSTAPSVPTMSTATPPSVMQ